MEGTYRAGEYRVVVYRVSGIYWRCRVFYFGTGKALKRTDLYRKPMDAITEAVSITHVPYAEWQRLPTDGGEG